MQYAITERVDDMKTRRRATRFLMIRRGIAIMAVLAVLLTSQMGALASEQAAPSDTQDLSVLVLPATMDDLTAGEDDGATAGRAGVSVWGKCQVPGKCEVGVSIKIRF